MELVKLSGGPRTPPEAEAPGLGAPFGPFPPPSTVEAAVGSGPVGVELVADVGDALLPFEAPLPEDAGGAMVDVMTVVMLEVNVLSTRPAPRVMPVVTDVEVMRTTLGAADDCCCDCD